MKKQLQKVAFLDRDGTLIFEPPDTKQIDSLDMLQVLPGVTLALKALVKQGYVLVMVSNQDGLGTASFPRVAFEAVQKRLLKLLRNEKIVFGRVFVCPHFESDNCGCRKPKIGLLVDFLAKNPIESGLSFVVGDRESDALFADNLGISFRTMPTNGRFPSIT